MCAFARLDTLILAGKLSEGSLHTLSAATPGSTGQGSGGASRGAKRRKRSGSFLYPVGISSAIDGRCVALLAVTLSLKPEFHRTVASICCSSHHGYENCLIHMNQTNASMCKSLHSS